MRGRCPGLRGPSHQSGVRIRGLSPQSQATLRLRFVDDLEYDAIARRLDCSPEAARQRVSTALRTLRRTHDSAA